MHSHSGHKPYDTHRSWELYDHTSGFLGCGSSTLSKAATHRNEEPPLIARGKGCRVWDYDGNEYIDFANALGPITLGHAIPEMNSAIAAQLEEGIIFGRPHILEGEVAELLCEIIPCAERVRFLKTGGEAIAACIRIARYATGRDHIVHSGYNGWINNLSTPAGFVPAGVADIEVAAGVPAALSKLHASLPWGDIEIWNDTFSQYGDSIAAVVIAANYERMDEGFAFLPAVRELCDRHGVLLVFDEIVTGFRLARAGAQEYFGVIPDLAVYAKGMANGMPISAYVGKADLIESCRSLGISSTFGGETLSLAAVRAVQSFYDEYDVIAYLWKASTEIWTRVSDLFADAKLPVSFVGAPVCPIIKTPPDFPRNELFAAACRNGLLLYNVPYTTYSHREHDIADTIKRFERVIQELT